MEHWGLWQQEKSMLSNATLQKALGLLHDGRPEECRDCLEEDVTGFMSVGSPGESSPQDARMAALALDALGRAYFAMNMPRKGIEYLRQGASFLMEYLAGKTPEPASPPSALYSLLAGIWQNLSFASLELGDYDESREFSRKALETGRKFLPANSSQIAAIYFGVSALHYRLHEWDAAERLTLRAKEIWDSESARNPEKAATCMNNLGRIYEERGETETGIIWHRKAVTARRELPDKKDLAFSLGNLGVALAQNGQWQESETALVEAVDLYDEIGMGDSRECQGYKTNLEICKARKMRENDSNE